MRNAFYIWLLLVMGSLTAQTTTRLGEMPEGVWETSGLLFHKGRLITHNDSGNTAELFEIDTLTLSITRSVTVLNAPNKDWEDIAQDDTYIYIADFGNNLGNRQDLGIYRILKSTYDAADTVTAEEIGFSYEDQTDFSGSDTTDWDAEALFVLGDQLIVLTKQWQSNNTMAYAIPKVPGNHTARKMDGYAINGLVTGATYNPENGVLHIIGYNTVRGSFLYRVTGATAAAVFGGLVEPLETTIGFAQTEGITFTTTDSFLISSERFVDQNRGIDIPSALFSFKDGERQPSEPEPEPEPEPEEEEGFVLFSPFGSDRLEYHLVTGSPVVGWAIFDSSGRQVRLVSGTMPETGTIDVSTLHSAIYYFNLYLADETLSYPFSVD